MARPFRRGGFFHGVEKLAPYSLLVYSTNSAYTYVKSSGHPMIAPRLETEVLTNQSEHQPLVGKSPTFETA